MFKWTSKKYILLILVFLLEIIELYKFQCSANEIDLPISSSKFLKSKITELVTDGKFINEIDKQICHYNHQIYGDDWAMLSYHYRSKYLSQNKNKSFIKFNLPKWTNGVGAGLYQYIWLRIHKNTKL